MASNKKNGPAAGTRGSTSTVPTENTGKQPPAAQDEESDEPSLSQFMNYVRQSFTSLNDKVDRVLTGQDQLEAKLNDVEERVTTNSKSISDLTDSVDFNARSITEHSEDIAQMKSTITRLTSDLKAVSSCASQLQLQTNQLERYSRAYNVRLVGVPEQPRSQSDARQPENCVAVLEGILKEHFGLEGTHIENAHRTGTAEPNKPRQIIAKFYSRPKRAAVMRAAREKLGGTPYRLMDDLTAADVAEKKRLRPLMDDLYQKGKRPSIRNGRLYSAGKIVPTHAINSFLANLAADQN